MSRFAFVYLARHAGAGFEPLAEDIAAVTRPGDRVLIVDDSGAPDTATRIGRFTEQEGWGPGVTVSAILTGTAAEGDPGAAANLALDALAVPEGGPGAEAAPTFVLFLCAGGRLDPLAFDRARAEVEAGALDVLAFPLRRFRLDLGRVVDVAAPEPESPAPLHRALALHPGLDGMILRWTSDGPLRAHCAEQASFGTLGVWWRALTGAAAVGRLGFSAEPLGHRAHPADPDAGLFQALTDLVAQDSTAAAWIDAALPRLLAGLTAGGVSGLLATGPALAQAVTAALQPTPHALRNPVLAAFASGDLPAARRLLQGLRKEAGSEPVATPALHTSPARMRVCVTGRHAHRQPFAYTALAPLWQDRIALTDATGPVDLPVDLAVDLPLDLIVVAHPHNLLDLPEALARAAARGTPVALISEEPFWDSLFSPDPLAHQVTLPAAHLGAVRAHQVTHHRSPIFDFERIPYYLLTDPGYITRYATLFARNAALTAQDWADAFARRPHRLTFMAERRPEAFHDVVFAGGDITGLCAWRTRLAIGCTGAGVQRLGASWGHGPSRFALADWHADKIAQLDGQTRILSGIENTHQPTYLSEKLFDAFACGARPLYLASPGHRAQDLGLPDGAWLNLWGHSSHSAVTVIETAPWDAGFYTAYAAAQTRLAALFTDPAIVAAERARLGRALVAEVDRLIGCGPA